jgi:serine/threonine protein kinase
VYFVTPPVNAITLDELIGREAPLSPDAAIAMLIGMADGLDTAHAAGMVHGAISPTTIWVESPPEAGPQARLVGFGLEALLRAQARGNHHERLLDDVLYVAPERLRGDHSEDGRADQYALACALYHCVAGRPPFARDRMSSLFGAHMLARPEPLLNGDSDPAFGEAIATGMAKDAESRSIRARRCWRSPAADASPPRRWRADTTRALGRNPSRSYARPRSSNAGRRPTRFHWSPVPRPRSRNLPRPVLSGLRGPGIDGDGPAN